MQVRTALKKLQSTGEIEVTTTSQYTHIKIVNYSKYQDNNKQITNDNADVHYDSEEVQQTNNKRITNEQQTNNKRITTTKEYKELKEREEEYIEIDGRTYKANDPNRPLTFQERLKVGLV